MRFKVLGSLEVDHPGQRVTAPRELAALARLLLEPNAVVSKDELVEGLWRDSPPPSARRTVDSILSRWRRRLGKNVIETVRPGSIRLLVEDRDLDSTRFRQLLDQGFQSVGTDPGAAAATLDSALRIWRGDPFPELVDWLDAQPVLAELSETHSRAEELRIDALLRTGQRAEVVGEAERLVAAEPVREARWALLIRALAGAGRQAEALKAAARCRTVLIEQAGVEPGPVLSELEHRILHRDPELIGSPGMTPRVRSSALADQHFGRSEELSEISAALEECRVLTLTGPGGIGKTRLARLAARDFAGSAVNEVYFVELAALPHGADAAVAVAESIGVKPELGQTASKAIVDSLRQRQSLLVLDNAEHVVDSTRILSRLLIAGTTKLRIVVTSREILDIPGEHVLTVPTLGNPNNDRDAIALFADRARNRGMPQTDDRRGTIAEICAAVDYVPLAIELAAAQTRSATPGEILHELRTQPDTLYANRSRVGRHDGIDRCIAWSFALLDDTERDAMSRLAVFRGGFDRAAADAVLEQPSHTILHKLVSQSLLTADTSQPSTRYWLLEPIRQFAERASADRRRFEALHAEHFAGLAATIDNWFLSERPRQATETFALEFANFRAAHSNDLKLGRTQQAADLVADLGWIAREQVAFEVLSWTEAVLESASSPNQPIETEEVQATAIGFHFLQGNLTEVERVANLVLASPRSSVRARYRAAFDYAWTLISTGHANRSEHHARTALAESETIGNEVLRSGALSTLAVALSASDDQLGDDEAQRAASEAVIVADRSGDYARATSRVFSSRFAPQPERVALLRAAVEYAEHAGLTQFTNAAKRTLAEELLVANGPVGEPAELLLECLETWSRLRMRNHWMFTLEVTAQCLAIHGRQDTARLIWAHQLHAGFVPSVSYRREKLGVSPPDNLTPACNITIDELTSKASTALRAINTV